MKFLRCPNFKFAVYLGASAIARHSGAAIGATKGYIVILGPKIVAQPGSMDLWQVLCDHRWYTSAPRGIKIATHCLIYDTTHHQ